MIEYIIAALLAINPGDARDHQVIIAEATAAPKTVYHYKLGLMREKTREYKEVRYKDQGWRKVPIINGYVPEVHARNDIKGVVHVTYDYRKRIEYAKLKDSDKKEKISKARRS